MIACTTGTVKLFVVIEYTLDDPERVGDGEKHRLVTSLLDEKEHPAKDLIVLYHERWEEEIAIDEVKTHLRHFRSCAAIVQRESFKKSTACDCAFRHPQVSI